jgi:hypothetical protein
MATTYVAFVAIHVPLAYTDEEAIQLGINTVRNVLTPSQTGWIYTGAPEIITERLRKVVMFHATLEAVFLWQKHDGPLGDVVLDEPLVIED